MDRPITDRRPLNGSLSSLRTEDSYVIPSTAGSPWPDSSSVRLPSSSSSLVESAALGGRVGPPAAQMLEMHSVPPEQLRAVQRWNERVMATPVLAAPAAPEARCDFRGNRLPKSQRNLYVLLRTAEEGPEPGLYRSTFRALANACLPLRKLPQDNYGYRRVEDRAEAQKEWEAQGHLRVMPEFEIA